MPIANYQRLTGQKDEAGNPLTTNTETSGRYHSNWLNMMYPRLKLARNLLREDGMIFISIDDHEAHNLRKICDEIFGEGNFYAHIEWIATTKAMNSGDAKFKIQNCLEYVLVYGKIAMREHFPFNLEKIAEKKYPYSDLTKGKYRLEEIQQRKNIGVKRTLAMVYEIPKATLKDGYRWTISNQTSQELIANNELIIKDKKAYRKLFKSNEVNEKYAPLWSHFSNVGTSESGRAELDTLLDSEIAFETVKPKELIQKLIFHFTPQQSTILDFFSGSATTAHAVMQLNAESKAKKAGYKTIAEIGKERIRRATEKIKQEHPEANIDVGFKVLKLDTSNIKKWQPDSKQLELSLLDAVDNILPDRNPLDLLYEVLLKYGLPLTLPIETISVGQHQAFNVAHNSLIACFDLHINLETIQAIIGLATPDNPILRAVFRDHSFANDVVKLNSIQRLKQAGIEEVLSI
ncbi:site-specific DNA-methyltransferase [Candidatus Nitrosacidococcus sp. I8]|uniref:site-specific DNA-methyltransferase n=1 Tax=Candidatus Nitrosacidococcus sp. I8 TaxID=2942908 RepID=UPI0022273EAA|nr:site-specific DNA-methyltransferase [Candidatus Nitrosacidococcus sp. I8]CAH9018295.1 hypothetical protein NURINAE_00842 [Candidatus Nitrosacidococcus sp. I8]